MRILTLVCCLLAFGTVSTFAQSETQTAFLKDLRQVVEVTDEVQTFENDGQKWLEVKQGKKDNQIEVTHFESPGTYSTRYYYLTEEGLVINGKRSVLALQDGDWVFYENNKAVKKQIFVRGELMKEKQM